MTLSSEILMEISDFKSTLLFKKDLEILSTITFENNQMKFSPVDSATITKQEMIEQNKQLKSFNLILSSTYPFIDQLKLENWQDILLNIQVDNDLAYLKVKKGLNRIYSINSDRNIDDVNFKKRPQEVVTTISEFVLILFMFNQFTRQITL